MDDRHWNLSCPDWERKLTAGQVPMPRLPLLQGEADLAVAFFDMLRLPDVPGKPLMRDAAGQWFKDIVAALFGSWDADVGIRFIEEVLLLVPKKNSKTTNGAGLMLVAMLMNQRPRAEFLLVGPTQAISDLAYSQASGMVQADAELSKRFHVRDNLKSIDDRLNGARLKIKTFDLDILTGPRPAGVLLDEIHLLGSHSSATRVLRQLRGGRASIPEGFLIMLTTQSDEPPAGMFRTELATARAIRDGKMQGKMLPVLYELPAAIIADRTQPWAKDTSLWHLVLPNLGRSLDLKRLREDFETERTKGEGAVKLWASQHLNIEIGLALGTDAWAGARYWERRADAELTLDEVIKRSEVLVAGIDGGGLEDLLALTIMGRDSITKQWLHWAHGWVDAKVLENRSEIAPRLRDFEEAGELTIVETLGDDVDELMETMERVDASGKLAQVGLDPVGVGAIVDACADVGIGGLKDRSGVKDRVVGVSQGWRLNGAIKTVERKLADGTMLHGGQGIMSWCVGNAKTETHGNATLVTKAVSGKAKIDCLMATFDAVALLSSNPQPPRQRQRQLDDFLAGAVVS